MHLYINRLVSIRLINVVKQKRNLQGHGKSLSTSSAEAALLSIKCVEL